MFATISIHDIRVLAQRDASRLQQYMSLIPKSRRDESLYRSSAEVIKTVYSTTILIG